MHLRDRPDLLEIKNTPDFWKEGIGLRLFYLKSKTMLKAHNFTGEVLYPCARCLLRKAVVLKLLMVQYYLLEKGYRLKIFDCYRPYSIQFRMWEKVPDPRFVARPSKGSNHNRGSAVDCTIVDSLGRELDMGSGFDDFSEKSRFNYPWLTEEQKKNREFLRRVMGMFGFEGISTEWWHFNDNRARFYSISDFPLCEKKEER